EERTLSEQLLPEDLLSVEHGLVVRKPGQVDAELREPIGRDEADALGGSSDLDHARKAIREDPVVGLDDLAILACGVDEIERAIVVCDRIHEIIEPYVRDSRV